jgi:uncharacterized protein
MDFQFPVKPPAFQVMLKPIGPVCNLDCTYCYYLEKKDLYPGKTNYKLDEELLEIFIRDYIAAQDVPVVSFVWQGGEPTMLGVDYFRKAVEIQNKYARDKRIENSFQTNGTLLTDEFCRFFRENNFLIGISIDGPKDLHDHYRLDKQGRPSWDKVMAGVELLKKHNVEFNTLSVVNKKTSQHPLEVYRFLKQIGSTFIQFIPIVERIAHKPDPKSLTLVHHNYDGDAEVTPWSVASRQYGVFLNTIFDDWVRNDVGRHYVQMFDVTLANWVKANPGLCVFSETCGTAAVMEHNGDVFSCDHFVYEDYFLGNIAKTPLTSMMASPMQARFGQDKKSKLPPYCLACDVRFACHGDCPKHRFAITPKGDPGLSYLCEGYKLFFEHTRPYMQFMANELKAKRAPANVMQWVRNKDAQMNQPKKVSVGRNEPCPCGSGKKYKQCHGR